ncbi:hypothetical protein ACLB2K_001985 [Fragaria x ananassa]
MDQRGGGGGGDGGGGGVRAGASFIWFISCSLFLSIMLGGGCLITYIIIPHDPGSMSWLAITGVVLVCLPWMFWFFTFIYRVVSRMRKNRSNSEGVATLGNVNTVASIGGKNNTNAAGTTLS